MISSQRRPRGTRSGPVLEGNGGAIVAVEHLSIAYGRGDQESLAVRDVSVSLHPGEIVALVGESGSGKTSVANAILGLLPSAGHVVEGHISILGTDIVGRSERVLRSIRGSVVGLIPQDPMVSLNPTMRVGQQIGETVRLRHVPRRSVPAEVFSFLERAGLEEPQVRARQYPHELSGGIRQRVLVANALAGTPKAIVADEPTSALDVTIQRRMLDHLERLVREEGIGLILITHDLAVASDRADRVLVMKEGRVVEQGPSREVLEHPHDPYTQRLLAAAPAFAFRTAARVGGPAPADRGTSAVPGSVTANGHSAPREAPNARAGLQAGTPVLALHDIVKDFPRRGAARGEAKVARVLDGVSFEVPAGQTLALVGESGAGKTTLMRIAMRLTTPTAGSVSFDGEDITNLSWSEMRPFRKRFQLVHQDPFSSLDPRMSVEQSIVEPLLAYRVGDRKSRHARAVRLLEQVALPASYLNRRPKELSGGQRQRVAIARALSLEPELVLLDEPVSALDVSVQAQSLDLLVVLQRDLGVAYLFITHDLAVVAQVASHIAVLGHGKVAEVGPTETVFEHPRSEITRQLLDAIPGRRWLEPESAVPAIASA
jgi:ABC-type glutathione transport system ATPase component